tara:strand:- start:65 stop:301 length:237 start_codon:yes stop_codon:yes gene_type:complete
MTKFKFRKLLTFLGISQGRLSRETGLTRTAIGNYYNGRRPVQNTLIWGLGLKEEIDEKNKRIIFLEKKLSRQSPKARN